MNDFNAPETALLDLDWLIEQASLFITANAIASEWESRVLDFQDKVSGCPGSSRIDGKDKAYGLHRPAPAAMDDAARQEVRLFLAHESVADAYDIYLDRMGKLELACRKEEVSRRLNRLIDNTIVHVTRVAA